MKKKDHPTAAIKEGQEDKGIEKNKTASNKKGYPRKEEKDEQFNNQPEFIEGDNNKKEKDQPKR